MRMANRQATRASFTKVEGRTCEATRVEQSPSYRLNSSRHRSGARRLLARIVVGRLQGSPRRPKLPAMLLTAPRDIGSGKSPVLQSNVGGAGPRV